MKTLLLIGITLIIGFLLGFHYETMDPLLWRILWITWMLACIWTGFGWVAKIIGRQ